MITAHNLPSHLERGNFATFEKWSVWSRVLDGKPVVYSEEDSEGHELWEEHGAVEGVCLGAYWDDVHLGEPEADPAFLKRLLSKFRFVEVRNGIVRLLDERNLGAVLVSLKDELRTQAPLVAMADLNEFTCGHHEPSEGMQQLRMPPQLLQLIASVGSSTGKYLQYPGAYSDLYDTGNLTGVLNRRWCHILCGCDIVLIENDLCLYWYRGCDPTAPDFVRLFPFRLDRSAPPGPFLMEYTQGDKGLNVSFKWDKRDQDSR